MGRRTAGLPELMAATVAAVLTTSSGMFYRRTSGKRLRSVQPPLYPVKYRAKREAGDSEG
jgi:hypothetical protein